MFSDLDSCIVLVFFFFLREAASCRCSQVIPVLKVSDLCRFLPIYIHYHEPICIGKPKDLWKALRSLGLPSKSGGCLVGALAEIQMVIFDINSVLRTFKIFYSNLARNLLANFPKSPNRYTSNFVADYLKKFGIFENFKLDSTTEDSLLELLKNVEVTKAAEIDQISRKFLKDGVANFGRTY